MKKTLATSVLLLFVLVSFGQSELNIFQGNLDEALVKAQKQNKDIYLITKSYNCPVFQIFEDSIDSHESTIEYLNSTFIIYQYDMDNSSKKENKRMKKYYNSFQGGFPQLHIIDKNENLITEVSFVLDIEQDKQLKIWKTYKTLEKDWKLIRKNKRKIGNDYNLVNQYITYRKIKYSSFDLFQIKFALARYFKALEPINYSAPKNWPLFEDNITIGFNPKEFEIAVQYREEFKARIGETKVSDYLFSNYQRYINFQKPKKVEKLAKEYPYNTIPEAIKAIEVYRSNLKIEKLPQDYSVIK